VDDIDRIVVGIVVEAFHETVRLGTKLPSTTEEAQFNLAWPVAAMLVDGEIGPNQTLEHRLKDRKIKELTDKLQ
jgi:2-methylcitrate dehydratase PrpD